jgi:uncharacterized protein YciI
MLSAKDRIAEERAHRPRIDFETLTVSLFEAVPDPPKMNRSQVEAMQDAHLMRLADLHDKGLLQVAGPFESPPGRTVRGLAIHRQPPETVRALLADDPYVAAGVLAVRVFTWRIPKGAISFSPVRFPRTRAED